MKKAVLTLAIGLALAAPSFGQAGADPAAQTVAPLGTWPSGRRYS